MKRYSKTIAQQCKYYEVENIFEYMVETYINGNHSTFTRLFKELEKDARRLFIEYLLWEVPVMGSQSPIPCGNTESNHLNIYGMDKKISQMTREEKLQALTDYHACNCEWHIILHLRLIGSSPIYKWNRMIFFLRCLMHYSFYIKRGIISC